MGLVPCIAVSTGYILLVLFLAELARRLVAPLNPGLVKTAFNVSQQQSFIFRSLFSVALNLVI